MAILKNVIENEYIFMVLYKYNDCLDEYRAEQVFAESEAAARLVIMGWPDDKENAKSREIIKLVEVNGRRV